MEQASSLITQSAHPDANIIWGTAFDESMSDELRVTVVATGFENVGSNVPVPERAAPAASSVPSAVFSEDTAAAAAAAPAQPAAPSAAAPAAPKSTEDDDSYFESIMTLLSKRK